MINISVVNIPLLLLYFLAPSCFYFYTIYKSKRYDRDQTWCENALKIHKPYYVITPLLIMGFISILLISQTMRSHDLYSMPTIIGLGITVISYIFWVISIFITKGMLHSLIGSIYIISFALLSGSFIRTIDEPIALLIFIITILLNLFIGLHLLITKKAKTVHEELQMICLTLYHIVIVMISY